MHRYSVSRLLKPETNCTVLGEQRSRKRNCFLTKQYWINFKCFSCAHIWISQWVAVRTNSVIQDWKSLAKGRILVFTCSRNLHCVTRLKYNYTTVEYGFTGKYLLEYCSPSWSDVCPSINKMEVVSSLTVIKNELFTLFYTSALNFPELGDHAKGSNQGQDFY